MRNFEASAECPKKSGKFRSWCWMVLKLGMALGIIGILIGRSNIKWENFAQLHKGLLVLALLAILLQNILTGIRWFYLMRGVGLHTSGFQAVSLTLQGVFFTLFIPGGSVSGDVVKAGLIAKNTEHGSRFQAVFSILIDRICGLCGLLFLTWCVTVYALFRVEAPSLMLEHILRGILWIAPLALLLAAAAFRCDVLLRWRFLKMIYDTLNRWSKGALGEIEAALAAYRNHWKMLIGWSLFSGLVAFPLISLAVWLIVLSAQIEGGMLTMAAAALLAGSIGELAGILPLTPGGIGVRDAVFAEIFLAYGFPPDSATLVPIVFTSLFVAASCSGGFFLLGTLFASRRKAGKVK